MITHVLRFDVSMVWDNDAEVEVLLIETADWSKGQKDYIDRIKSLFNVVFFLCQSENEDFSNLDFCSGDMFCQGK